ncbi:MAG: hypothetical protein M1835_002556 [Candelina submexicana]|nr:MAG: hypothetical protein M1835_002556 [Candelina submexicana]
MSTRTSTSIPCQPPQSPPRTPVLGPVRNQELPPVRSPMPLPSPEDDSLLLPMQLTFTTGNEGDESPSTASADTVVGDSVEMNDADDEEKSSSEGVGDEEDTEDTNVTSGSNDTAETDDDNGGDDDSDDNDGEERDSLGLPRPVFISVIQAEAYESRTQNGRPRLLPWWHESSLDLVRRGFQLDFRRPETVMEQCLERGIDVIVDDGS